jgi:hypothetical protein
MVADRKSLREIGITSLVPQGRLEMGRDDILGNLQPSLRD